MKSTYEKFIEDENQKKLLDSEYADLLKNKKIKLRPYQKDCLHKIVETFKVRDKQIVQMPTGAGKTILFWSLIKKLNCRTLIIVPSLNLGYQAYEKGLLFFDKMNISRKFATFDEEIQLVHITTIQSLYRSHIEEVENYEYGLIVIDECHKASSDIYLNVLKKIEHRKLLGVTATPMRNDNRHLSNVFEFMSYEIDIVDLIDQNYLSDVRGYRYKTELKISSIPLSKGDFCVSSLFRKINTDERNSLILKAYLENLTDRKTLLFTVNVEHCLILEKIFLENQIKAKAIYGTLPQNTQKEILSKFRKGEISVLINNQLLTEGFDEPSIDGILIARPTLSPILYQQMMGRGTRIYPGKDYCKLIEITDNHHRVCNFWVMSKEENIQILNDQDYKSGSSIKEIRSQYANLSIEKIAIEEINVFQRKKDISFEYLLSSNTFLNTREILFFKWKERKLKEFRKWQTLKKEKL